MISNKVVEVGTNLNCVLHTTCRHNSNKGEETLDRDRMTDFNLRVLKHTFIKYKKKVKYVLSVCFWQPKQPLSWLQTAEK